MQSTERKKERNIERKVLFGSELKKNLLSNLRTAFRKKPASQKAGEELHLFSVRNSSDKCLGAGQSTAELETLREKQWSWHEVIEREGLEGWTGPCQLPLL